MGHVNIEIKARCTDQNKIREILKAYNAESKGTDHQIDTYFKVNSGRMKLREGIIENYLVFYNRENIEGPKQSDIILHKTSTEQNISLKKVLMQALDTLAIVDKKREIFFIENVKFHLDTVEGLGQFIEIEAIDSSGTIGKEKLLEQCNHYLELFEIKKEDLLAESYSDLILK